MWDAPGQRSAYAVLGRARALRACERRFGQFETGHGLLVWAGRSTASHPPNRTQSTGRHSDSSSYTAPVPDPIRIVIAKPGLDGHDRGAKVVARALRDAGMEVIYTGLHQTPDQIVETALQEDADAVGLSILSGAHMTLVPRVLDGLREQGADDVLVLAGGTIPDAEARELREQGVAEVFTPGTSTKTIIDFLMERLH
jgi:methylmalonyl-CoA mutase C-terminal domain/subunit